MQRTGKSRQLRAIASGALGLSVAGGLAAASGTAVGNPHRTFGLLLLLVQLPGDLLAHALLNRNDGVLAAPGERALAIAVNAAFYGLFLYLVLWRVGRRHTLPRRPPAAPAT